MTVTVAKAIAQLQRLPQDAVLLWHPQSACVAEEANVSFKAVSVREIKEGRYSVIGEPREKRVRAVLMDVRDER